MAKRYILREEDKMANKTKTGLGRAVDSLVERSRHMKQMIAQARRQWPGDFRIMPGNMTNSSGHTIIVNRRDSPLEQALGLAHELGHLLNKQGVIPGGRSFEEFVKRNVNAQIREEAAAVKAEIRVREELRRAGLSVPPHIVGNKINLESLLDNDAEFLKQLRRVPSEVTGSQTLEVYWRSYYKKMPHIYKGLAKQPRWIPTGRTEPFPRDVSRIPMRDRQPWLRDYYRANPAAAQRARREARTIIDWANKHLKDRWRIPTGRTEPFPRDVSRIPMRDRQPWLHDYYRANPAAAHRARREARTIIDWADKHLR